MVDAEKTLIKLLDEILDEKGYKPRTVTIEPISTGGANYSSELFRITVSSPRNDELKLFAKVACIGESLRGKVNIDWFYATEKRVYLELVKIYKDMEDKFNVPDEHRFVFPKLYGCNSEIGKETVVMENLFESGYESFDRFKIMDWEYACAAIENVAKFHALSFAFSKHYPEEFNKFIVGMSSKMPDPEDMEGETDEKNMFLRMIEKCLLLVKKEHKDAVRGFLFNPNNRLKNFNSPTGQPVIAHGDYRMSNLLFRRVGEKVKSIALDYQSKVQSLGEALKRLSVNVSEVYPRENYQKDLKKMMPFSLLLGIMLLPIVMVEAECAPKLDGNANSLLVKSNEVYALRFTEIVEDFIKL